MNYSSIQNFISFSATRNLILGGYYPLTSDEGNILINRGLGYNLINFVNDNGYSYLYPIMS